MLELFGTIAGNVLSLPGVLGLALGMLTRKPALAAILGALVGLTEAMIFANFNIATIGALELSTSVVVGVIAASIGSVIRQRGATV